MTTLGSIIVKSKILCKLGVVFIAGFSLTLCILGIVLSFSLVPASGSADPSQFFAGKDPHGKPLEKWAQLFWQWWVNQPSGYDKVNASTGMNPCLIGSDPEDSMIFLINAYDVEYKAKCELSSQMPIMVPLLVGECDPTVPDERSNTSRIQDKWACARESDEIFRSWEVNLDGNVLFKRIGTDEVNVGLINDILVRNSSIFMIDFEEGNRFDAQPGTWPAVVDGYYMVLKPLRPGNHILQYKFIHDPVHAGPGLDNVIGQSTYNLTVR